MIQITTMYHGIDNQLTNAVNGGPIMKYEGGYGWISNTIRYDNNPWLQLEYDEPITVKEYVLYLSNAVRSAEAKGNLVDFQLLYKNNEEDDWEIADQMTGNTESVYRKVFEEAITAKYFRILVTKPAQDDYLDGAPWEWLDNRATIRQWEMYEQEQKLRISS